MQESMCIMHKKYTKELCISPKIHLCMYLFLTYASFRFILTS